MWDKTKIHAHSKLVVMKKVTSIWSVACRVLYPSPWFLFSATWPSMPKMHSNGLFNQSSLCITFTCSRQQDGKAPSTNQNITVAAPTSSSGSVSGAPPPTPTAISAPSTPTVTAAPPLMTPTADIKPLLQQQMSQSDASKDDSIKSMSSGIDKEKEEKVQIWVGEFEVLGDEINWS